MTTTPNPISYNDIKRLAGDVTPEPTPKPKNTPTLNQRLTTLEAAYDTSTAAAANRLKEHTETLKEANRRANWQDQRIAELSDKLRTTQICLTLAFAGIVLIATVISSFYH
ncbi:hypothetical protein [Rothia mucilaginosa]|uniref:hypothetical protein n=1 Tax=Rothia mucilaginosa TaxID=43675 RepID=UPI00066A9A16|nr:hypothetical protein [Rothia mucilaginosa]